MVEKRQEGELLDTYLLYDQEKNRMDKLYENHFYPKKFDDDINDGWNKPSEHKSFHKSSIFHGMWYPGKTVNYLDESLDLLKLRGMTDQDADAYIDVVHTDTVWTVGGLLFGAFLARRTKFWWEGFALSFPAIRRYPIALPVIQASIIGAFAFSGRKYVTRDARSTDDALGSVLGNSKVMVPRNAIEKRVHFDPHYINAKADLIIDQFEKRGVKLD